MVFFMSILLMSFSLAYKTKRSNSRKPLLKRKGNTKKINTSFVKELLSNAFFDNYYIQPFFQKSSFLGGYNQQLIFNVEKSILVYKKALFLVRFFDFFNLQILFLGSPKLVEFFFKSLLFKTRHFFFLKEDWLLGFLTNKRIFPSLIVCFKQNLNFSTKESIKKHIPLICFFDTSMNLDSSNVDYSIFLKMTSHLSIKLFFNFFKHLLSRRNGKR